MFSLNDKVVILNGKEHGRIDYVVDIMYGLFQPGELVYLLKESCFYYYGRSIDKADPYEKALDYAYGCRFFGKRSI